ncbi:hypothetical protein [Mesoterricola sediminis]|uniref:Uncharacterized protein n=1 Tax=Mesoterricola sediminis TaxID=2927980 RepID=A0AA48GU34_9BACT|nr:hypothetical protein [Mesoterricola sediminis]BDU76229.1 hypothetical protein METESE_11870 [Mesoterricola sediminis]
MLPTLAVVFRCRLCGRNKFERPSPHMCAVGYLKHYGRRKYKERYPGGIFEVISRPYWGA